MNYKIQHYHWRNVLFFSLTPIAALFAGFLSFSNSSPAWQTWLLFLFYFAATGLSITAGYHRLWSHRSYDAKLPVRLFFLLFGSASYQHSVLWWSAEHRIHHRFEDTDKDPYGINKGFWYAHIGWLLEKRVEASYAGVADLAKDPWLRFQDKYFYLLSFLSCFVLPGLIASTWGDFWNGVIWAGLIRMVINHHATFCINSVCHFVGRQRYSNQITARDSWIAAIITFGEGYHNFHHKFSYDYRNAIKAWQWDPTKWLINAMTWCKLASNLKRADARRIFAAIIQGDEEYFLGRLTQQSEHLHEKVMHFYQEQKNKLLHAEQRMQELKQEYFKLKEEYYKASEHKFNELQAQLQQRKQAFKSAQREWKKHFAQWKVLIEGPLPSIG